jgi:hypothetical protein
MFCVYTLRQHPLYTLASLVAYTLLQPLRIPKGACPCKSPSELFRALKIQHKPYFSIFCVLCSQISAVTQR